MAPAPITHRVTGTGTPHPASRCFPPGPGHPARWCRPPLGLPTPSGGACQLASHAPPCQLALASPLPLARASPLPAGLSLAPASCHPAHPLPCGLRLTLVSMLSMASSTKSGAPDSSRSWSRQSTGWGWWRVWSGGARTGSRSMAGGCAGHRGAEPPHPTPPHLRVRGIHLHQGLNLCLGQDLCSITGRGRGMWVPGQGKAGQGSRQGQGRPPSAAACSMPAHPPT